MMSQWMRRAKPQQQTKEQETFFIPCGNYKCKAAGRMLYPAALTIDGGSQLSP